MHIHIIKTVAIVKSKHISRSVCVTVNESESAFTTACVTVNRSVKFCIYIYHKYKHAHSIVKPKVQVCDLVSKKRKVNS